MKEKLEILGLSEEQEKIAKEKFLVTLSLVTVEELQSVVSFLRSKGINITKAREIKVLANPENELAYRVNMAQAMKEENMYKVNPVFINSNPIDVNKRIQSCKQQGISYKKEDGTYEPFLFSEVKFSASVPRVNYQPEISTPVEEEIVSLEPVVNEIALSEEIAEENINPSITIEENPVSTFADDVHIDIQEYQKMDFEPVDAKTTDFKTIREELEGQLEALDELKNSNFEFGDEISFEDLEPESYGMGR